MFGKFIFNLRSDWNFLASVVLCIYFRKMNSTIVCNGKSSSSTSIQPGRISRTSWWKIKFIHFLLYKSDLRRFGHHTELELADSHGVRSTGFQLLQRCHWPSIPSDIRPWISVLCGGKIQEATMNLVRWISSHSNNRVWLLVTRETTMNLWNLCKKPWNWTRRVSRS